MGNKEFFDIAVSAVVAYYNELADKTDGKEITKDDVFYCMGVKNASKQQGAGFNNSR